MLALPSDLVLNAHLTGSVSRTPDSIPAQGGGTSIASAAYSKSNAYDRCRFVPD